MNHFTTSLGKIALRCCIACLCLVLTTCLANGSTSHVTTFDSGFEEWTDSDDVFWRSSGDPANGYLVFEDYPGRGHAGTLSAPASYLGDWTNCDVLSYDFQVLTTQSANPFPQYVYLDGPGGSARWAGPTYTSATPWVTCDVPIQESEWTIVSGEWGSILDDVTSLKINMQIYSGDVERTAIDNIVLHSVPEPSILVLLAMGAIGLLARGRRWK